jgi:hypothetical protein
MRCFREGVVSAFADLAARWREDAELLERYGDERGAAACRLHASQLEEAVRDDAGVELTLSEAAAESGYSADRLRHLVAEGAIANAGRKGSPRIRRADLPRRASKPTAFDADASARRLLGR